MHPGRTIQAPVPAVPTDTGRGLPSIHTLPPLLILSLWPWYRYRNVCLTHTIHPDPTLPRSSCNAGQYHAASFSIMQYTDSITREHSQQSKRNQETRTAVTCTVSLQLWLLLLFLAHSHHFPFSLPTWQTKRFSPHLLLFTDCSSLKNNQHQIWNKSQCLWHAAAHRHLKFTCPQTNPIGKDHQDLIQVYTGLTSAEENLSVDTSCSIPTQCGNFQPLILACISPVSTSLSSLT